MKKAAFYTLGCKVNQYETEAMEELFSDAGYEICDFSDHADIYVINTCSVTHMGDRKSRQIIRRAKKANPDGVIAVTGCYSQTAPEEILNIDGVNLVLGTQGRHNIVELSKNLTSTSKVNGVSDIMHTHDFEQLKINRYADRTRAYIKIQDGCSQFCSYCIIPYARGPVRSRPENEILKEISELAKNGYSEIILVGIHVASYGKDIGTTLENLLIKADKTDGIKRIRMSSIEPMTLNGEFVEQIKHAKKLCPHFHISLQSGCDETLKRMNRHYTAKEFADIVEGLRSAFPGAAITTDIMVGFPGETDEEFEKTAEFVKSVDFADAHVFMYSPRRGTPAAKHPDQITPEIKELRSKKIIEITNNSHAEFLKQHIGKTAEVLFEQVTKDGYWEGKTANYITVKLKSAEYLKGVYKTVLLKEIKNGEIIAVNCD